MIHEKRAIEGSVDNVTLYLYAMGISQGMETIQVSRFESHEGPVDVFMIQDKNGPYGFLRIRHGRGEACFTPVDSRPPFDLRKRLANFVEGIKKVANFVFVPARAYAQ